MAANPAHWSVLALVIFLAAGSIYYQHQHTRPCTHAVAYAIGSVDPGFDISSAAIIADAEAAAAIWNKAGGKTLLTYDPSAKLKINLVYDEREASAKLRNEIAGQQAGLDTVRASVDALHSDYVSQQAVYDEKVRTINARGGASASEAAQLDAERRSLEAFAESVSSKVEAYNATVKAFNTRVREFNRTADHPFEEGQYVRDSSGERINIFEFVDATQLKRVLAHEFGHALGLDHDRDPDSIMYAMNESGNLVPTASDLAALKALCGN